MKKNIKVGLITSRGGHLLQLYYLKNWWAQYDRFWITGKGADTDYLLKKETVYHGFFPENRNLFNAFRNFLLGFRIIMRNRPFLLVSVGAGIAPPIFLAGKILGCHLVFIDSYSFVEYPSLSAKLASLFVDKILVQHKSTVKKLKRAEYWGSIL